MNQFKFVPAERVVVNRPQTPQLHGRSAIVIACGQFASTIVIDSGPKIVLLNRHLDKEEK